MAEYYTKDKMNKVNALDFAIRDYELEKYQTEYGYYVKDKPYLNYMSNKAWKEFLNSMSSFHKAQYNDGDGGELSSKKGRYGWYPPKMASFGSSSRFIYNQSKDIQDFCFEKQLPTRVGHTANLDGYLQDGNTEVFIEAKCREIYSSHAKIEIANVYKEVYEHIEIKSKGFSFEDLGPTDNEHFNCTFKFNGQQISHFDIKQLICHFLGICANLLENKKAYNNILFLYLIFDPHSNTMFDGKEIKPYENCILEDYMKTLEEIKLFGDMKWLLDAVMEYQEGKLKRINQDSKEYNFRFRVASQKDYKKLIEEK